MEAIKNWLVSIFFLGLIIALGYWAFISMESGGEHVVNQKVKDLEFENRTLQQKIEDLEEELAQLRPVVEEPVIENVAQAEEQLVNTSTPTSYKNQTLINELQKLIDDKVSMKLKSRGTRVGTVQNFLNLYNGTTVKVDNDYGAGTVKAVAVFQKAVGLNADGEAGASTFQKMIDWLKKQG